MAQPVRYTPDVETPGSDERETIEGLTEQFKKILDTTSQDYGHAVRSVHAKAHGLVPATFEVHADLPAELAQGLFARPGTYDAMLRFSTNAGDILDDSIRLPRGLAVKVLGVEGDRLPGSEGDTTQDFVTANAPTFAAPDPNKFLANLKMLAATTDKGEGAKKVLSSVLRAFEAGLEAVGGQSAMLSTLGGAKPVHPLGATYYSQVPFRFGDYIAKWQFVPVSRIKDFAEETIDATGRPDANREAMNELLQEAGGVWEMRVQLNTDLDTMPIEDATAEWDEKDSPYRAVATITVEPQAAWVYGDSERQEDKLSYNVWHGLAAHQPLGAVNRARNDPYRFSADYRGRFNGCPIHEPKALAELAVEPQTVG